ncbi:MAG TPA: S41 family peptidase [Candidatus Acidoferrales bacterium]|nr:S41 family peptidase [Candidatus Acidoferrales bacterium]
MRHVALALAAASLLVVPFTSARAQFAPGSPDDPDTPLDASTRSAVVESLADAVQRHYVFPDKGAALARELHRRLAAHAFDRIASSRELADSLLAQMQASTHDLHMRCGYRYDPLPEQRADSLPEAERRRAHEAERARNFGFERVQRLAGNVGYVDLRTFSGDPDAQATAIAAMNFLGNTDAIIFDLRRNGGGSPEMIQTLLTYLTPEGGRLHINDFYQRDGDRTVQFWTSPTVPGRRLDGKPVYVLTSAMTGSAAEEFSYDVPTHELGTLYGATTAGAANPGGFFRLGDHFFAFIATGRAINPETHTNWEGVGVKPEHGVPAGDALREAHVAAVQTLIAAATDPATRQRLGLALEQAKQTPSEPASDFERPAMRREMSRPQ